MARKYRKVAPYAEELCKLRSEGKTLREAATELGLTYKEAKELVGRINRRKRQIEAGYIPRPKGRPRKDAQTEEQKKDNQIVLLKMQVEVLHNFLCEVGRR